MNSKCMLQILIYLISPEDSSGLNHIDLPTTATHVSPSIPPWICMIKALFWALIAVILPLAK